MPAAVTRRQRSASGLSLLLAAYGILLLAWVVGNPPGMSVDEPAHYRKAVGLAYGDVFGQPGGYARLPATTASEVAWLNRTSRAVKVPPSLRGCDAFRLPLHGRCPDDPLSRLDRKLPPGLEISYVATYPPFAYLPAAVAVRVAAGLRHDTTASLMAGRIVLALGCLALVGLAGWLFVGRQPVRLAGFALALSPMVVFLMAELSGNGLEVSGAICLTGAALALTRASPIRPAWAWAGVAGGGFVLATSRALGPAWVVAILVSVVLVRGHRTASAAARRAPAAAGAAGSVLAVGVALSLGWRVFVEPGPALRVAAIVAGIGPGLRQLPGVAAQAVGMFGWVDVPLPQILVAAWGMVAAGLLGLALAAGSREERRALAVVLGGTAAAAVLVSAVVVRPTSPDFEMQGRYVLPMVIAFPLLVAEVAAAHAERVTTLLRHRVGMWAVAAVSVTLAVQAAAWAVNAVHYSTDPAFLRNYPQGWSPPGGWAPWALVTVVSIILGWVGARSLSISARRATT